MTTADEKSLLAAEEARRVAMVANDIKKLGELMADDVVYTHSTGGKDSKQEYLQKLSSGALRYEAVEFTSVKARVIGTVGLLTAAMTAHIIAGDGNRRVVSNTYLAVYEHGPSGWTLSLLQGSPAAKA